jgi:hypothetical protein
MLWLSVIIAESHVIIKWVPLFESSLLLYNYLQDTQTLQVTTKLNWKLFTKVIWTKQTSLGLHRQIVYGREAQAF